MEEQGNDRPLSLPDTTRVQMVAVAQAVVAAAVAFGVPISDGQSVALVALAGVIGTTLIGADAAIRRERARNADKLQPRARITHTAGGSTAEMDLPLGEGGGDVDARMHELLRSFELMARFLEAERTRDARPARTGNGARRSRTRAKAAEN